MYVHIYIQIQINVFSKVLKCVSFTSIGLRFNDFGLMSSSSRCSISSEICLKVVVLVFVILERSPTFRRYSSEPVVLMF